MPAHSLDPNDKQSLARLLLAIVLQSGGELRVKSVDYDSIDKGRLLIVDYDREKSEIVIRSTSDFGKALVVPAENSLWLMNQSPSATPQIQAEKVVQRRTMRTDEQLADFEEQRGRESKLASEAQAGRLPRVPFRVAPPKE